MSKQFVRPRFLAQQGLSNRTVHGMFSLTILALSARAWGIAAQAEEAHEPFLVGRIVLIAFMIILWLMLERQPRSVLVLASASVAIFAAILAVRSGNLAGEPFTIIVAVNAVTGLIGGRRYALFAIAVSGLFNLTFVILISNGWIHGRDFIAEASFTSTASYAIAVFVTASFVALASSAAEELSSQLQRSNAELEATLRSAPIGIATINERHIIVRSNRVLDQMLAGPDRTMVGRRLASVVDAPSASSMHDLLTKAFAGQATTLTTTVVFVRPDGRRADTQMNIGPVDLTGGPRLMMATVEDVSERRLLEREVELMQRRRSLGVLAGGIAHDFNNLLAAVQAHVTVARTLNGRGEQIDHHLDKVIEGTERASLLTRQLLDYAGNDHLDVSSLSVNQVIEDVLGLLAPSLPGIEVQRDLAAALPTIVADAGRLQQVIMNLMLNAKNAIGFGGGTVSVMTSSLHLDANERTGWTSLSDRLAGGHYVCIDIADTGGGISPEHLDRIFDPFFTTDKGGHGLGLSVALGIVRSHRGALQVTSDEGIGTQVSVLLPVSTESGTH